MEKGKENVNGFMRRILFIYLGKKNDEDQDPHHCIADNTIKEYKEFFKSDIGGCWEEKEENSELVDLNLNATNKDLMEEIAKLDNFCYSIIVYVGHGNSDDDDDNDYIQIPGNEPPLKISELYTPGTKKRLLIIDACRSSVDKQSLNESKQYNTREWNITVGNKQSNKKLYNGIISDIKSPHVEIIQSTEKGHYAQGVKEECITVFAKALFEVLQSQIGAAKTVMQGADFIRNYSNLISLVNEKMRSIIDDELVNPQQNDQKSVCSTVPTDKEISFPLVAVKKYE